MIDLIYIAIAIGFFVIATAYTFGLKRLQPEADDE